MLVNMPRDCLELAPKSMDSERSNMAPAVSESADISAQTLGIVPMARDMGEELKVVVHSDSSAALAMSQRVGLGKVRHIDVQYLWIQERHAAKEVDLRKVKGEVYPADLLTNGVPQETLKRHAATAGIDLGGQ